MADATPLMAGKRGLIMGIANDRSLAWGIARALAEQGAELAVTYQGEVHGQARAAARRAAPGAAGAARRRHRPGQPRAVFATIAERWGRLDFLVHAIA